MSVPNETVKYLFITVIYDYCKYYNNYNFKINIIIYINSLSLLIKLFFNKGSIVMIISGFFEVIKEN